MTPVIVALVKEAVERPAKRVSSIATRAAAPPLARATRAVAEPPPEAYAPPPPVVGPDPGLSEMRVYRRERATGRRWKLAIATGLLACVIAVAAMTLPELVAGRSVVSGSHDTTIFGGRRSTVDLDHEDEDRREEDDDDRPDHEHRHAAAGHDDPAGHHDDGARRTGADDDRPRADADAGARDDAAAGGTDPAAGDRRSHRRRRSRRRRPSRLRGRQTVGPLWCATHTSGRGTRQTVRPWLLKQTARCRRRSRWLRRTAARRAATRRATWRLRMRCCWAWQRPDLRLARAAPAPAWRARPSRARSSLRAWRGEESMKRLE